LLADVIRQINNPYCGTLPDFGNFCMRREKGDLWESPCVDWYDRYKGVEEMLPFAKGVSAKTFDFNEAGNETTIDYMKMMKLVKESKYKGYVGIEYEGNVMSEEDGILATKKLLESIRKQLS
jgi:sugar phosphate isomerase/epimerase